MDQGRAQAQCRASCIGGELESPLLHLATTLGTEAALLASM